MIPYETGRQQGVWLAVQESLWIKGKRNRQTTALLENSYWNLSYFGQGAFTVTLTGLTANTDYELITYMTGRGAGSGGTR